MTRLWRVPVRPATNEESRKVKLSGTWTEVPISFRGLLSFFITIEEEHTLTNSLKRTALFDSYAAYGGKTIDFGGWELPVQFSSIKVEHEAVRRVVGPANRG